MWIKEEDQEPFYYSIKTTEMIPVIVKCRETRLVSVKYVEKISTIPDFIGESGPKYFLQI